MIILTGGAGMIGSMIAWHLNTILNENKFVVFDDLVNQDQEKNLAKRKFIDLIDKNNLPKFLRNNKKISAVIHMGAISATTESNFNKLLISNIRYSQMLWSWCSTNKVPFIYASSAATYGGGENGAKTLRLIVAVVVREISVCFGAMVMSEFKQGRLLKYPFGTFFWRCWHFGLGISQKVQAEPHLGKIKLIE